MSEETLIQMRMRCVELAMEQCARINQNEPGAVVARAKEMFEFVKGDACPK